MDRDYVIWSFEHESWWRPGSSGYTRELADAGRFTQAEADAIVAHANVIEINEAAVRYLDAHANGRPRYVVIAEHNHHGGDGWTIFDYIRQQTDGGWFADRIAAEQTAAVLNRTEASS